MRPSASRSDPGQNLCRGEGSVGSSCYCNPSLWVYGLTELHHVCADSSGEKFGKGKVLHCLLVVSRDSCHTCPSCRPFGGPPRGAGPQCDVKSIPNPPVELLVVDRNRAGVKEHLALSACPCLACDQTPLSDVVPLRAPRMPIRPDEVIDSRQNVVRGDCRTLGS
jgi:hypothetical protein